MCVKKMIYLKLILLTNVLNHSITLVINRIKVGYKEFYQTTYTFLRFLKSKYKIGFEVKEINVKSNSQLQASQ